MKRSLFLRVGIFFMILASLIPVSPAHADTPFPDVDEDGLPNEMETSGWYNLTGGPFFTDPFSADSDQDGLTDGEEKLFGTNPVDYASPGIYVRYQDSYETREYFSPLDEMEQDDYGAWIRKYLPVLQGGNKYLMTDAMVVRRGTTLRIGGPISGTLTIDSDGLSTLTPVANTYSGDWSLNISGSVKVGTYTATLSVGGAFEKSMPLYVIFELPTPATSTNPLYNLPEEAVQAFVYDDDPADKRDEVSVWWRTPEWSYYYVPPYGEQDTPPDPPVDCNLYPTSPCSNWQYHHAKGYAQAFWTEQFTQKVFVRYAMAAIRGQTSQSGATTAIANLADTEYRVKYINTHNSWSTSMFKWWNNDYPDGPGWSMQGGACQDNANIYTTLLRSAGIAARPFLKDYNKTAGHGETGQIGGAYEYDHSVLVWLGDHWKATSSYKQEEKNDYYYPWQYGIVSPRELRDRGYTDIQSDLLLTANGKWDWQNGSDGGGMVNTVWDGDQEGVPSQEFQSPNNNWDYDWNSRRPLEIKRTPYMDILNYQGWHGDGWAPSEWLSQTVSNPPGRVATQTYNLPSGIPSPTDPLENWPYNPKPTGCSPSIPPDVCAAFVAAGVGRAQSTELEPPARSSLVSTLKSPYVVFLPSIMNSQSASKGTVQLGEVVSDHGLDLDGDGRFDELVVQVQVTSHQAGAFRFGGWLQVGERPVRAREDQILLIQGAQTVQISFDGQEIGNQNVSGPYRVINLWVAEPDQPIDKLVSADDTLDYEELAYSTAPYQAGEFTVQAAQLTGQYWHQGLDDNGDGYYESLAVYVPLKIGLPGTFQVEGDLYDRQGHLVDHATWTGSDATARLQFQVAKAQAPYTLERLMLLKADGQLLDSRFYKAYEINDVASRMYQGPVAFSGLPRTGEVSLMAVTATHTFAGQAVDTDGNGRFDQLVFTAGVTVTDPGGDYRLEGLLVDPSGIPVAWSVSDPQTLSVGDGQLTLSFDGRVIHDHMAFSPITETFTLVAVKIFSGTLSLATLEDQVPVAMTTAAYTRDQFDAKSIGLFEDNMERGSITDNNWTEQTSTWSLNNTIWHSASNAWRGSGTNGRLTSTVVSLAGYVKPALRFDTAYRMTNANQRGYLEVSTNGTDWTRVATYTNATRPWTSEYLDLSDYDQAASLQMRFNINSASTATWYVDDVYLNAWPAVTSASFTYSPQPVLTGQNITFVADYESFITTLPVTFTWDFDDGSPIQVTNTPTVIHQFAQGANYDVELTVENPYDGATHSEAVHADQTTDLSITKSDSPDPALAGHPLTYRVIVNNAGPKLATGVVMTDVLPSGVSFSSVTPGQGSCEGTSTIVCSLGSLAPVASGTITIVVNVPISAAGILTNTAIVGGDQFDYDPDTTDNMTTQTTIVTGVNEAPSFTKGSDQTVLEDAGPQTATGWATNISPGPADESGQTLTFMLTSNNPMLFTAGPAINPNSGDLTFTPAANMNGSATVTVTLKDNGGTAYGGVDTSGPQTFHITITAVNDAPVAVNDAYGVGINKTLSVSAPGVLDNDSDVENNPLTAIQVSGPAHGTLTLNSNGSFIYTPTTGYTGTVGFTYKVSDGQPSNNWSNIATVTIEVGFFRIYLPVVVSAAPTP